MAGKPSIPCVGMLSALLSKLLGFLRHLDGLRVAKRNFVLKYTFQPCANLQRFQYELATTCNVMHASCWAEVEVGIQQNQWCHQAFVVACLKLHTTWFHNMLILEVEDVRSLEPCYGVIDFVILDLETDGDLFLHLLNPNPYWPDWTLQSKTPSNWD